MNISSFSVRIDWQHSNKVVKVVASGRRQRQACEVCRHTSPLSHLDQLRRPSTPERWRDGKRVQDSRYPDGRIQNPNSFWRSLFLQDSLNVVLNCPTLLLLLLQLAAIIPRLAMQPRCVPPQPPIRCQHTAESGLLPAMHPILDPRRPHPMSGRGGFVSNVIGVCRQGELETKERGHERGEGIWRQTPTTKLDYRHQNKVLACVPLNPCRRRHLFPCYSLASTSHRFLTATWE